jgi:SAM-dependent methyltransferase
MQRSALHLLACPVSGSPLRLETVEKGNNVASGSLVSATGLRYPIVGGIPRFNVAYRSEAEQQTVRAFGAQWTKFDHHGEYFASKELFFQFVPFLTAGDFAGRTVLDAGCGSGRWTRVMTDLSADRVIALDYSDAVEVCARNTDGDPQVTVVQGSLLDPPVRTSSFDIVVSIGVIHHLADSKLALSRLARSLTPRGRMALWLYSREGNETYLRLARLARVLTTKLGPRALLPVAQLLALPVFVYARTLNEWIPLRSGGTPRLPLQTYIALLRRLELRDLTTVVYDQMAPTIAHYYTESEVRELVVGAGLQLEDLRRRTQNSWCVLASRR